MKPRTGPDILVPICTDAGATRREVQTYRRLWPEVPILALGAIPSRELAVELLEAGADDVLIPSQVPAQLGARLRALHRRYNARDVRPRNIPLIAGDVRMDFGAHKVWVCGSEVSLSPTEFRVLRKLCMHVGRVVPHRDILMAVWGDQRPETAAALRVYIRHIRTKVRAAGKAITIVARPGIGYMLALPS